MLRDLICTTHVLPDAHRQEFHRRPPVRVLCSLFFATALSMIVSCSPRNSGEDLQSAVIQGKPGERSWLPWNGAFGVSTWTPKAEDVQANRVLIVYGGYSAQLEDVQEWAAALFDAFFRTVGVSLVVSVQGPNHPQYLGLEIGNSFIANRINQSQEIEDLIVISHSSGSFVSSELFGQLKSLTGDGGTQKLYYFNLDGARLPAHQVSAMSKYFPVYATRKTDSSRWASVMQREGDRYENATALAVDASQSGCRAGKVWCLHDAVINTMPHNPDGFDLVSDYRNFSPPRAVVTSYLQAAKLFQTPKN